MTFEATEENKLSYTPIFQEYSEMIEKYLNDNLKKALDDFDMERFIAMLEDRKD